MRFDDATFLLWALPALLTLSYAAFAGSNLPGPAGRGARAATTWILVGAGAWFIASQPYPWLVLASGAGSFAAAAVIGRTRLTHRSAARLILIAGVAANLALFLATRWVSADRSMEPLALGVVTFLSIAFLVDVFRGEAEANRPLTAALALAPLPLLVAGPIVRYHDIRAQAERRVVGMGPFIYGVRRFVTGLLKVTLVADVLDGPVTAIFSRHASLLTMDAAWLGVVCLALQFYFRLSGWADMAIGLGRLLGFRLPENFRRPYTAESMRDFWRRWNITLMTGLRDYLHLPIAGRDSPTLARYVNVVLGFCVMGFWHGSGWPVLVWSVYAGLWLALEEVGLGARIARLPRPLRHAYVLLVVSIGWVLLRAESVPAALAFLETMAGLNWASGLTALRYMSIPAWLALGIAVVGAGPLVPSISRWRVSVDAATVSLILMAGATGFFVWRGGALLVGAIRPSRGR